MKKELATDPIELKEEDIEIIESGEEEKEELCGADESFEDSKPRPNEK